jgi:hypothetical protein
MVATQRHSNEMLRVLRHAVPAGSGSIFRMRSIPTTDLIPAPDAPVLSVAQLHADPAALQAELLSIHPERDLLCGLLADVLADQVQLRVQIATTQAQLAAVEAECQNARQELVDLKQKSFTPPTRSDDTVPAKPRSRAAGHVGSSRRRPTQIDHTQAISAGDTCPDCGTPFTGIGTTHSRVVEDSILVHATIITKYVIERRWCSASRTYQERAVTDVLPRHRMGLHVLLFVVY